MPYLLYIREIFNTKIKIIHKYFHKGDLRLTYASEDYYIGLRGYKEKEK